MPFFSIIIPTYNVEKYVCKCLDSISEQTYEDWEAICINDGSTDDSMELLEEYAGRDDRFRVITQENQGLAETRNVGIKAAKGEWILFVDSDDFIRNDTLEVIRKAVHKDNLDAISFETDILYEGNRKERDYKDTWFCKHHFYPNVTSGKNLFEEMMKNDEYCDSACLLALRREWLLDNNFFFYKGILYEDTIFSMEVFLSALRMRHISEKLYTYRVREASIMTSGFTNENIRSRIIVFKELVRLINKQEYNESLKKQCYRYVYLLAEHVKRMDKMCKGSDELILNADEDFIARLLKVSRYKCEVNTHVILNGIESIVNNCSSVALYGAGNAGRLMLYFISSCKLKEKIECFLVSKLCESNQNIQGIPVYSLNEYEYNDATVIVCVMDYAARKEIVKNLEKKGIRNVELCDDNMFLALEKFSRGYQ